jgi:hypothetical protein
MPDYLIFGTKNLRHAHGGSWHEENDSVGGCTL